MTSTPTGAPGCSRRAGDLEWRSRRSVSSPENKLNSMDVNEEALVDAREDLGRPVTAGDVSKSQISQDKSRLQEFTVEQIDEPAVDAITSTVFQTAVDRTMVLFVRINDVID